MATPSRQLSRLLTPLARRVPTKRKRDLLCPFHIHGDRQRRFSTLSSRQTDRDRANGPSNSPIKDFSPNESEMLQSPELADIDTSALLKPVDAVTVNDLGPEEHEQYKSMTPREQENYLAISSHFKALLESPETEDELQRMTRSTARDIDRQEPIDFPDEVKLRSSEVGYWADDEPDELGEVEDGDDDFKEEYITSVAENELELQREIREYARITSWDMPLLSSKPSPPSSPDPQ